MFGFLRYAEKVGEHKTGRIGEQQAAGVDKPLLVCDYGQHQDAAHGLRSGAYVTKEGNERTADTGTQAGSEERFAQRESNTVNQGLADAEDAEGRPPLTMPTRGLFLRHLSQMARAAPT